MGQAPSLLPETPVRVGVGATGRPTGSLAADENAGAGGPERATLRVRVCWRVSWMFSCMRHVGVHV